MSSGYQKKPVNVVLLGASGTIGRAVLQTLHSRGYRVICPMRAAAAAPAADPRVRVENGDLTDPALQSRVMRDAGVVISCLASRTGTPDDAHAVDHALNSGFLRAAQAAGVERFILLSALCVQRPELAFQKAKLAFETELRASGLNWTIVRPTAFFKSLSGQMERVRQGKPFLVFGDGTLTACKPISDADLARFIVDRVDDPGSHGAVLPIGGPGPAQTPLEQGQALAEALGRPFRARHVPVALLDVIIAVLGAAGLVVPRAREKAELARIGRHYATRSMLVWDAAAGCYSDDGTPETGTERLEEYFVQLAAGEVVLDRGAHAVF
ncbi:MAG: NAD(P)H-binding protein [Pseudomonadota bacterium]